MNEGAVVPDEDALGLAEGWSRFLHPRRGGLTVAPVGVSASAVKKAKEHVARAKVSLDRLNPDASDGDLAELDRRHLEGEADPAGAAVVALVAAMGIGSRAGRRLKTFADAWAAEHGLAFAACAVVELSSITIWWSPGNPQYGAGLSAVRSGDGDVFYTDGRGCARRIRTLLACADDTEYEQAVERLAAYRDAARRRVLVSYLVPTQDEWVTECCRQWPARYSPHEEHNPRIQLFQSLSKAAHVRVLGSEAKLWSREYTPEVMTTLVDGLGPDALPVFLETLDDGYYVSDADRREVFGAIAMIPGDEAFRALLGRLDDKDAGRALFQMKRYPARAIRVLAESAVSLRAAGDTRASGRVTGLLKEHLPLYRDVAAALEPALPEESRALIASVAPSGERVPDAPLEGLPPLLVDPPWERREGVEPVVLPGLKIRDESRMVWDEGERETWSMRARTRWSSPFGDGTDWEAVAARYQSGWMENDYSASHLITEGPEEIVRPLLAEWKGRDYWDPDDLSWLRSVVGRYGLDALPLALTVTRTHPSSYAALLLPFLDPHVAKLMAGWFARSKSVRGTAVAWFDRHGTDAARLLITAALGKAGTARRDAEEALLLIASRTGDQAVVDIAREHGEQAADAIAALLATGPLDRLPAKMPEEPEWADPGRLPQVLSCDGDQALPASAVRHLVTMLAMSKPGEVYAGVDVVREWCDPASLTGVSWGLFQEWQRAGAPSKDGWALHQLAWLGDDETARRLTPLIRAWPGEGGHHKAVAGLDVLAAIGSDVALLQLHGISEKAKFKGLKARAREKIAEVAAGLGLTGEQLSDRLVPDFGLDTDGGMVLDYGPRRFTVGFDEQLKPYVTGEDGKRRKALPKPGAKDDATLAPAAWSGSAKPTAP
jgi:hypothetical protein